MKLLWTTSGMPHGYLCATPVHVVYRVAGCLPIVVLRELTEELFDQLAILRAQLPVDTAQIELVREEYLLRYDELLDAQDISEYLLADSRVAEIIVNSWKTMHLRGSVRVMALCLMGNHVHAVLSNWPGKKDTPVGHQLRLHKSFTANEVRKRCGISEELWTNGYFDRYVRPGKLEQVISYVLDNPVKAGLAKRWEDWPFTWVP